MDPSKMVGDFIGHPMDALRMIGSSPALFCGFAVIVVMGAWFLLRLRYHGVIEAKDAYIKQLEASATMDADALRVLQQKVQTLEQSIPRRLTNLQQRAIVDNLCGEAPPENTILHICADGRDFEAIQYASDIVDAFRVAKWPASMATTNDAKDTAGLVLKVFNREEPPRHARSIATAF